MTKAEEATRKIHNKAILEAEKYSNSHGGSITEEVAYGRGFKAGFIEGYEQAEKDIIAIVKEYVEKGFRCMEQSEKFQMHTFWDGFHNCAENILREMEDRNE